jgi:C4-dicarboxylate-specific signal transduction histidine kinase
MVQGDPIQLQQVALNLLRNGMESMASIDHRYGNQIVLRTQGDEEGVRISVVDRGSGVSAEAAEQLYKPFASTKEMGMGVGLSICKSIIHSHGGQLDFVNMDGHGATFFFTLPYTARDKQ